MNWPPITVLNVANNNAKKNLKNNNRIVWINFSDPEVESHCA